MFRFFAGHICIVCFCFLSLIGPRVAAQDNAIPDNTASRESNGSSTQEDPSDTDSAATDESAEEPSTDETLSQEDAPSHSFEEAADGTESEIGTSAEDTPVAKKAEVSISTGEETGTSESDNGSDKVYVATEEFDLNTSLDDLLNIELVTSVSRVSESASTSPSVITVVTQQEIREMGYRHVRDILLHIPGFWEIQDVNDRLIGARGIHSSTSQKYLVLINNKRFTENMWNLADLDFNISLANVKRVEIIRGPGSAIYGRAALTAVINIITDENLDGIQFDLSMGNNGYKKGGLSVARQLGKDHSFELWGHVVGIDGEERSVSADGDGATNRVNGTEIIDRYPFPTGSLGIRYRYKGLDFNILGQIRNYKQPRAADGALTWQDEKNAPGFSRYWHTGKIGEEHRYLVSDLMYTFLWSDVEQRASLNYTYSSVRLHEVTKSVRDIDTTGWSDSAIDRYAMGEMFEFEAVGHRVGADYFGNWNIGESKSLKWGVEGSVLLPLKGWFESNYETVVDPNEGELVKVPIEGGYYRVTPGGVFDKLRTEGLVATFLEARWQFWKVLYLSAGARYDLHIKGDDYAQADLTERYPDPTSEEKRAEVKKTTSQISPRVAIVAQPFRNNLLTLKAIYNKSFIAPAYFYRYADPSTSYAGGPWLKEETLDNFTFDVEGLVDFFEWRALYFININKHLLIRDTQFTPARYASEGKLSMHGTEAEVKLNLSMLSVYANYTFLVGFRNLTNDATEESWFMDDNSIKNFPKHWGSCGVVGRVWDKQITAGAAVLWNAHVKSPVKTGIHAGEIVTIDPTAQLNANVRWVPSNISFLEDFELQFSMFNVIGTDIQRGGTVNLPYHIAGRWWNVTAIKKF